MTACRRANAKVEEYYSATDGRATTLMYFFQGIDECLSCSVVGFCDASRRAYMAVVLMKIRSADS